MRDLHLVCAALAVAALVGCGGEKSVDPSGDGGMQLDARHDAAATGLSGTLLLNHAALPGDVKGWVYVYTEGPGAGAPPVAFMEVAADGAWSFPDLPPGTYYLLGGADVNRSGTYEHPGDALADQFVIPAPQVAPAAGITLDVVTMWAYVGSVRVAGPSGDENALYILRASVFDPRNANTMTNATVTVSDGTREFPLAFAGSTYEPATTLRASAVDGTYTFTVQHLTAYQTPLDVEIRHQPLLARPAVSSPTADQHFAAVEDVEVAWQPAAGTTDSWVEVWDGTTRVYSAEAVTSPHVIAAATAGFTAGHTYRISVMDLRYGGNSGLVSIEAGATDVTISF
jgi:hypothetical protein